MKKIIDLLAGAGSHKDEKLLDYVRRNYLINNKVTNICFVTGVEDKSGIHTQITADELKELVFKKNDKNTIYFLRSFYTTNVDGEIKIDNLRIGDYKLIEKNTGKWYNLADDTEVKIEWNKLKETTIENELQKGQVKVIKIDKDNHEVKLKGVKFDILDEKGNILETITTNEKGEAYTSRYAIRDYSKLTI